MRKQFLLFLVCILLVLTLTAIIIGLTTERDYIIQSFQEAFNKDINPVLQAKWSIQYLSYETGISTDISPLNETILEITVENDNLSTGYKWDMAICNLSGVDSLQYLEEDANGGFENSYPEDLNYIKLEYEGLSETWCSEINGFGFVLFSGGSITQLPAHFRIIFPEGSKRIILITGSNSEKVDISYSEGIKEINGVAFVEFKSDEVGRMNNDTITMVTNIENLR